MLQTLNENGHSVEHLDVTQNDISYLSMGSLRHFLRDYNRQQGFVSLVLDKNNLGDIGIRELADGLFERFTSMEHDIN